MTDIKTKSRGLLTTRQLAIKWNCCERTVRRKIERGELGVVYLSDHMVRIPESEAERVEEARMMPAKVGGAS